MSTRGQPDNLDRRRSGASGFERFVAQQERDPAFRAQLLAARARIRGIRVASLAHRRLVWRWAREKDRYPTRSEWRFIIFGRWAGF